MTRRRFVPSAICVLAWLAALCHPSAGHAGAYSVRACHSDGVSAVWVPSYTANTVAYVQCPGGVGSNAGLIARNVTASTPATAFSHAKLSVNAPAGTYIDNIQYTAQVYNNAYWQSGLYDRQHGRWLWCGPSCGTLPIWSRFNLGGFATTSLEMLTICGSTQCRRDGLHGAVMLKDVTLRLQDVQNPAVSIVGGSLASGDWKRGVQTVEVSGSDNTGIREQRVSIDGALRDTKIHGCDDHRLVPCPRGSRRTLAVDTTKSSDGAHTLEVQAIDAAGNASSTRRNVLLDNSPPNPPESLTAAVTGWQAKNGFAATWSNPRVVVGSPIAGVAYELCPEAAPSNDCEATQEVSKGGIASLDDIKLPSPGSWRLALWLIDARMSGSSWNFVGDPRG